ncbi:hypothetical protein ACFVZN_26135 [Streptomyces virginiae]
MQPAYWDPMPTARRLHIDNGLEAYLRGYLFWLDQRREPRPGEALPRL